MSNINQILSRIVQMQSQIVSRLNKTPVIGSTGSESDLVEINQNIEDLEIRVQNIINANSTLSAAISVLDQKISKQLSGSIIPLNIKQISGSVVELSNEYNCYKLTPTATLNLQFDNSNVSEFDGGEFYLMVDFTNGIQTINFPDTFTWKNETQAPVINAKNLYIFKCTYLYTDPIAYVGEFVTSVVNKDYDIGIWSSDGQYNGELYINEIILETGNITLNINKNSKVNGIFLPYDNVGESDVWTLNINGGIVGTIGLNSFQGGNRINITNGSNINEVFVKNTGFINISDSTVGTYTTEEGLIRTAIINNSKILNSLNLPLSLTESCEINHSEINKFTTDIIETLIISDSIINTYEITQWPSLAFTISNSTIEKMMFLFSLDTKSTLNIINSNVTFLPADDWSTLEIANIINIDKNSIVRLPEIFKNNENIIIEEGAIVTYSDEEEEN